MKIAIIGAGPAGLGAAHRLTELGHDDWVLFEAADGPGGLASSETDKYGYTWDKGVHVLHSHYPEFDKVMDSLEGVHVDGHEFHWLHAQRSAWACIDEELVPYPVQENFHLLRPELVEKCLIGLINERERSSFLDSINVDHEPATFLEWIDQNFGEGLAEIFMVPYNKKVWGVDPSLMSTTWLGDRVPTVDLKKVLSNLVHGRTDSSWGPNATFRYPEHGGTGSIWKAVASKLPHRSLDFGRRVTGLDFVQKQLVVQNEHGYDTESYDALVSTLPLDWLASECMGWRSKKLTTQKTHVVGVGFKGYLPASLKGKSWIYYPGEESFYRLTVLSNFSPSMTPSHESWSVLCEVGGDCPDGAVVSVLRDLTRLFGPQRIESVYYKYLERGYPVPTLDRDEILAQWIPELKSHSIWSIGRFGSWDYARSNQDHVWIQGVEAVNEILGVKVGAS